MYLSVLSMRQHRITEECALVILRSSFASRTLKMNKSSDDAATMYRPDCE